MASVVLVVLAGAVLAVSGKRALRPAPGPGASRRGIAWAAAAAVMSAALAGCGSSPAKPAAPASAPASAPVVQAPVQVAHAELGAVGYRVVGSGPPLVLIMGYTGTMQDWDPRFVDALARHFRVVIFDNAGAGRTQPLPAPLTIDAMADQTSALISTLGLGRANVLGWSMGGMIAQALAVRHPAQVRRLVLCATYPGTGAVPPSLAAIRALLSGVPQEIGAELFPAGQSMAYQALEAGISSYPAAPPGPGRHHRGPGPRVRTVVRRHRPGRPPERRDPGPHPHRRRHRRPAGPGRQRPCPGQADPQSTAGALPRRRACLLVPGRDTLHVRHRSLPYRPAQAPEPVQHARAVPGRPGPAQPAGHTWNSRLTALSSDATPAQVTLIDQPYAAALANLDDQLLNFGATATAGAAITTFVHADENLIDDVLARAMQNSSTLGTWNTAITQDTRTGQNAAAALRKALGLPPAH